MVTLKCTIPGHNCNWPEQIIFMQCKVRRKKLSFLCYEVAYTEIDVLAMYKLLITTPWSHLQIFCVYKLSNQQIHLALHVPFWISAKNLEPVNNYECLCMRFTFVLKSVYVKFCRVRTHKFHSPSMRVMCEIWPLAFHI
jgi:hypothetical protein